METCICHLLAGDIVLQSMCVNLRAVHRFKADALCCGLSSESSGRYPVARCMGVLSGRCTHPIEWEDDKFFPGLAVVMGCHGIVFECRLLQRDVASRASIDLQYAAQSLKLSAEGFNLCVLV